MTDSRDTRGRVLRAASDIMGVPVETLDEASSPDSVPGWDSLKHMNLVLALEEEFGIRFGDDQVMQMSSLGLIRQSIDELLG